MNDDLFLLDGEAVEKNVNESYKTISRCCKIFSEVEGAFYILEEVYNEEWRTIHKNKNFQKHFNVLINNIQEFFTSIYGRILVHLLTKKTAITFDMFSLIKIFAAFCSINVLNFSTKSM